MFLGDDDHIDLSYPRQMRAVTSLTRTLLTNLPGVDERMAEACARNIVQALPVLGMPDDPDINSGG
jgi:hypothetical protein